MSEKTKLRIKDVIDELDYRPNILARNLKSKKSGLIGVIISDVTNPVMVHLISGIMDQCAKEGYQVITADSGENIQKEREYILSMVDRQVDGLIIDIVDYNEHSLLESLKEKGFNIVLADRTINKPCFDTVTTDNYEMSKSAVKTLYSMGYEAVALFSSDLLKSNVRLARYSAFVNQSELHIAEPERYVYTFRQDKEEDYKQALEDFISKNVGKKKAVFASTPMSLLNLLNAAYELNVNIPKDIGVCGYDNLYWTKLISGGITVIEQPFHEVGVESAKIILQRIRGELIDEPKYVELKSKLIVRNSTNL